MGLDRISLYPLRFEPIYEYRLWGGRRLADLLSAPLPDEGPIGEAWLLSDRNDHPSVVADGPLKGRTIGQLIDQSPKALLGKLFPHFQRFPLLLKFLDVTKGLSVQVHPSDAHAELLPAGESGKTEAWVVLEQGPKARIYAGLKPGATADVIGQAIGDGTLAGRLASFKPEPGESILIEAGTVHSLKDVVVFEVQENSDVTFRLFDWNHIDPKTHEGRPLQVGQAMACINFSQGSIQPVTPRLQESNTVRRETLIRCDHFGVCRFSGAVPFLAGAPGTCRVLVCLDGRGELDHAGVNYLFRKGDVLLLPAIVGVCSCRPNGAVSLLEISLPEIFGGE
jgi:mannose-6-phosphate isomerase